MKNTTRKHIWPMSLVMGLAVIGVMAVIVALTALPGSTSAQAPPNPFANEPVAASDSLASSSTSGDASVKLTLSLGNPGALRSGSSVVLYLEDDYQVGSIDESLVYFVGHSTGRVYVTDQVVVSDDDHFGGDDDWDIQVLVPDQNPGNDTGFDSWSAADTVGLKLVFEKAGIKNPTEAGTHSVGYSVLTAAESVGGPEVVLDTLSTVAKIKLSADDGGRGKSVTIAGTGFNNDTGAEAFVLYDSSGTTPSCQDIVSNGDSLGSAEVGKNDKFDISFSVHQDEFSPGAVNHICAADGEAGNPRFASAVKTFELTASITISPATGSYGDETKINAYDFGAPLDSISLGPKHQWNRDGTCPAGADCFSMTEINMKEGNRYEYVFDLPGGLDKEIQVAGKAGSTRKTTNLAVVPSALKLSHTEVAPNASIIVSGSGFSENRNTVVEIPVGDITLDGKAIYVDDAGTEACTHSGGKCVRVTSSGNFTATVRVWGLGSNNPALDANDYTIKAIDSQGFEGKATITILEPTVTVTPNTVSPRDYILISGENWPVSNADDDHEVAIQVDGRNRSASIDTSGRFNYEYRLRSSINIGDEHKVKVGFSAGGGEIDEETTFDVIEATIDISPPAAAPGQSITLSIESMPPFALVTAVIIDGADRLGGRNVNTDGDGDVVIPDILVPAVEPGFYPVQVHVGGSDRRETRVGQLEVLDEGAVIGVATILPAAASDLGDNLEAIFHFNNATKDWTFFDPRPEFSDLNTLTELASGQPYWVLVKAEQLDVDWNRNREDFTCAGGDCWNLKIW